MGKIDYVKSCFSSIKTYMIGTEDQIVNMNRNHEDKLFCLNFAGSQLAFAGLLTSPIHKSPEIILASSLYLADILQRTFFSEGFYVQRPSPGIIGTIRDTKNWKTEKDLENIITT